MEYFCPFLSNDQTNFHVGALEEIEMTLRESRKAAVVLPRGVCCGMETALLCAAGGCRSPQHPAATLTCLGCLEYSQKEVLGNLRPETFQVLISYMHGFSNSPHHQRKKSHLSPNCNCWPYENNRDKQLVQEFLVRDS